MPRATRARLSAPGVSFCGGGFLGAYHVGAASELAARRPHWLRRAPVAGASAGALVGAAICCGIDLEALREDIHAMADAARGPLGALNPLGPSLVALAAAKLEQRLPDDAHARCAGRLHVAISPLRGGLGFALLSDFESRAALIDALRCSSFVPGVTGGLLSAWPRVDGAPALDGGLTRNWPRPRRDDTVCVSPFAGAPFHVCPRGDDRGQPRELAIQDVTLELSVANLHAARDGLVPPSREALDAWVERGREDARGFLESDPERLPSQHRRARGLVDACEAAPAI